MVTFLVLYLVSNKNSKMTEPYPFRKIATAIAFSPYAEANLHESARIAHMLDADLVLIHVGKETQSKLQKLQKMVSQTVIDENRVKIEFREGNPVKSILASCSENDVDLLIAGAEKKENLLRFYTGSVARSLCRKATCTILLLTDRSVIRNQCGEIVVSGENHSKTESTVKTANYFGKVLGAERITIVDEIDPQAMGESADDDAQAKALSEQRRSLKVEEDKRIQQLEEKLKEEGSLPVKHKCIFGKPGYTIGHFAAANNADLLVVHSPDTELGLMDRLFTHDLEYILSDLPCCLMIVREPLHETV